MLGIITEATLKLLPLPQATGTVRATSVQCERPVHVSLVFKGPDHTGGN